MWCSHPEASILRHCASAASHIYRRIPIVTGKFGQHRPKVLLASAVEVNCGNNNRKCEGSETSRMICQAPWKMCSINASSPAMENIQGFVNGKSLPSKPSKRSRRTTPGQAVCFKDGTDLVPSVDSSVSCTTFNILAPIYKRINGEENRESQFRDDWLIRNQKILEMLLSQNSSILCLQEFWLGSDELVRLYEQSLGAAGYDMYKLERTNNRGDGLFTAIKKDTLKVLDYQQLLFHDCGDRVAQLLRLQSRIPLYKDCVQVAGLQELLLVNTHLIFPHNSNFCLVRLRQVYKILKYLEQYKEEHDLSHVPVILCGDWNGSKRGQVYKFLRSQGFVSSYDVAHQYTDSDADAHRWVSHRNHRGNVCGVDFIWLLNPSKQRNSLRDSWKGAVFGIIKSKLLREHGKQGREAFCFFQQSECDNCVTYEDFHAAMSRLELTKEELEGLSKEEIEELIKKADFDGNGVIDYDEFQETLFLQQIGENLQSCKQNRNVFGSWPTNLSTEAAQSYDILMRTKGFSSIPSQATTEMVGGPWKSLFSTLARDANDSSECSSPELGVKHASFHPPEVEQGRWPDNYSLSDHAPLTAIFAPVYAENSGAEKRGASLVK